MTDAQLTSNESAIIDKLMHAPFATAAMRRQAAETIARLMVERDERAAWAEAWHRALETVATMLEVPTAGSDKMLLHDINEAINKLRGSHETGAKPLACEGCGTMGNGIRRCCPDQHMVDAQQVIHKLWDLAYPPRRMPAGNTPKASVCICGEPNTQGVTHRTDGPCFVTPRAE